MRGLSRAAGLALAVLVGGAGAPATTRAQSPGAGGGQVGVAGAPIDQAKQVFARAKARAKERMAAESPHAPFTALLQKHVRDGVVSYKGFQADEAKLDEYLRYFAETDPATLAHRRQKLAFWINAYNAFTIKLILGSYPGIKSIKDYFRPWAREDFVVNGKKINLNDIEHEILRPMGEPRIHFAINCASFSCPDLASEAYVAGSLEDQLAEATRVFLANEEKGMRVKREPGLLYGHNNNVYLSKILSWFGADFGADEAARLAYLKPYMPPSARAFVETHAGKLSVSYMDYDWSLNGK